jgi:MFS family permease
MNDKENTFSKRSWLILLLFGTVGQIAWSVENMYFNLFVFYTVSPNLGAITLMVQLSGITATLVTLLAGALSDVLGNRRKFISIGYAIWGVTVALFGLLSPELVGKIFSLDSTRAIATTLTLVIVGDCVMTLFGSTANDAAFNAWVTDNTRPSFRGKVEGVLSILPLIAMLIVAGGFGILVSFIGYSALFLSLGAVISVSGIVGLFIIEDSSSLQRSGSIKDIFFGFKPSVIKGNAPFYVVLLIILVYGIASQIFMPYLIIYMTSYLGFTDIEYSLVFGGAILLGSIVNLYLTRLSDTKNKANLLYIAAALMSLGLFGMYFAKGMDKSFVIMLFGIFGFVMICGYIFVTALCGSTLRDYTPTGKVGKLQGVRMVFSVLIPMILGPMIGNAINAARNIPLPDQNSADTMTTEYVPAPEIFLAGAICTLLILAFIPLLKRVSKNKR